MTGFLIKPSNISIPNNLPRQNCYFLCMIVIENTLPVLLVCLQRWCHHEICKLCMEARLWKRCYDIIMRGTVSLVFMGKVEMALNIQGFLKVKKWNIFQSHDVRTTEQVFLGKRDASELRAVKDVFTGITLFNHFLKFKSYTRRILIFGGMLRNRNNSIHFMKLYANQF